MPLAAPDAKYQRPSPSTSLQISTRDDGLPWSSAVARVMACGAGTASCTAASSQRRNKVTGSAGAACGSNSGIPSGNTRWAPEQFAQAWWLSRHPVVSLQA